MDWPSRLCTTRLMDQNFGMCISPEELLIPFFNKQGTTYFRPWKLCEGKDFGSTIDNASDKFKITLDVQHFKPNEISVKVNDKEIVIEGNHEERQDEHGYISRKFIRRYALPKDCVSESISSTLSSDGVLSIIANKKSNKEIKEVAKTIPITMEGPCRKRESTEQKKITTDSSKTGTYEIKKEGEKAIEKKGTQKNDSEMKKESKNTCEMKKECQKEREMKKEIMNQYEMQKVEKDNKERQVMLKEEHSRLLKPELLGETAATLNTEKLISESKKETEELMKLITGDKTMLTPAAEKLDAVIGECQTAINELKKDKAEAMSMMSEISSMAASEISSMAASEISSMASSEISSMKSSMRSETVEVSMSSSSSKTTSASESVSEIICAELKEAASENT